MTTKNVTYVCDQCGTGYNTEEEATACESADGLIKAFFDKVIVHSERIDHGSTRPGYLGQVLAVEVQPRGEEKKVKLTVTPLFNEPHFIFVEVDNKSQLALRIRIDALPKLNELSFFEASFPNSVSRTFRILKKADFEKIEDQKIQELQLLKRLIDASKK